MCNLPDWDLSDGLGARKPCMCLVPSPNDINGVIIVVGHMFAGCTPLATEATTTVFGGSVLVLGAWAVSKISAATRLSFAA